MSDFSQLLQQGAPGAWLFIPSAVLLGALHGLEPGHSKTMMAAFIVAIRGTLGQAVLLGLSATASHTAVVWIIALTGLYFGAQLDLEANEKYFQLASAILIVGIAIWMLWRIKRQQCASENCQDPHELAHANDIRRRFTNQNVTTGQIMLFGLTGGLLPCPASITVLLLCLQVKQFTLGAALVLCFSIGLGVTLVASGALAAWSVKHATKRWSGLSGFAQFTRNAPYLSGVVILLVGLYVGYQSFRL